MQKAEVSAAMEQGYDGLQRMLSDLERLDYVVLDLRLTTPPGPDERLSLTARVAGRGGAALANLETTLSRHPSVRSAVVSSVDDWPAGAHAAPNGSDHFHAGAHT